MPSRRDWRPSRHSLTFSVLVDHQKDIKSEFKLAMAKIKGGVVVIFFDNYTTAEEGVARSLVESEFVIVVWTKPIIRTGETAADDIVSGWRMGRA